MENLFSPATTDQARKTAKEAQKLGSDVKRDFEDAVARGKEAADGFVDAVKGASGPASARARGFADAARHNLGRAAGKMRAYADANTALVAFAAFGVGLLVGHFVSRES